MKKMVTYFQNRKNAKRYELIEELTMDSKACLQDVETGEQKFYAQSTLKKNFFKEVVEVEVEVPTEDTQVPGCRANMITNQLYGDKVVIKNTNSYIGFFVAKKSVAQIAYNKKRLTVSVNHAEFFGYLESADDKEEVLAIVEKCFSKTAPTKYGWRMDYEMDVTDLTNNEIKVIIESAIETRC